MPTWELHLSQSDRPTPETITADRMEDNADFVDFTRKVQPGTRPVAVLRVPKGSVVAVRLVEPGSEESGQGAGLKKRRSESIDTIVDDDDD